MKPLEYSDSASIDTGPPAKDARITLVVLLLLLSALSINLLYPGEVFLASRYLWLLVVPLALAAGLTSALEKVGRRDVAATLAISFLPLALLAISFPRSITPARSEELLWLFFSYGCAFAVVRLARPRQHAAEVMLLTVCGVVLLVCVAALYQHFAGLGHLQEAVSRATGMDQSFRTELLTRIKSGRVFANFALPNSLAGCLATVLPFQVLFLLLALQNQAGWVGEKLGRIRPLVAALGSIQVLLSLAVLWLTQSLGGWLCVLCSSFSAGAYLLARRRVAVRSLLWPFVLVLLAGLSWVFWLTYQRGFSLWDLSAGDNPIALRWINFRTALRIFADFPVTGVGLGNYGTINPVYQSNPLHVTQYAHNTVLQLLSETGLCFLLLIILAAAMVIRKRRKDHREALAEQYSLAWHKTACVASLSAWSVHNLLDINLYLPSLGSLGVVILSLWTILSERAPAIAGDTSEFRKAPPWVGGVAAAFLAVVALLVLRLYLGQMRLETANNLMEAGQFGQAQEEAEQSIAVFSRDSRAYVLLAKLSLLEGAGKDGLSQAELLVASSLYQKAIALNRYEAQLHFDHGKILMALGQRDQGLAEQERARELFPSEPKYQIKP